jgi:hypothetical protein
MSLSGSNVVNGSKSFTVPDADVQNWINYLIQFYTPRFTRNADGTMSPGTPPTAAQALVAMANAFVAGQAGQVQAWLTKQQVATINIPPPSFT